MTAPAVGSGLEIISDEPATAPEAADLEYVGYAADGVTASTIAWLRQKGGSASQTPLLVSAAGNASTRQLVLTGGQWVRRYQKQAANDEVWAVQTGQGFGRLCGDFGTALGQAAAGSPAQVLRFVECLRFVGAINAGSRFVHGFAFCNGNLLGAGGPTAPGFFAGVGLLWNVGGSGNFDVFVKQAGAAPTWDDPGVGNLAAAGFVVIEHRLFYPGVSEAGRYEFLLNGVRRWTVDGADLPVPALTTDYPKPLYCYSENGNAGSAPGTETLWTRVSLGSADLLAR